MGAPLVINPTIFELIDPRELELAVRAALGDELWQEVERRYVLPQPPKIFVSLCLREHWRATWGNTAEWDASFLGVNGFGLDRYERRT